MTIESVHYYLKPGVKNRVCCVVLLAATFILGVGEKIAFANVPLIAHPASSAVKTASTSMSESIDIASHYPSEEEHVRVGYIAGSKTIHATPVVSANFLGTGGQFSGLGVDKTHSDNRQYLISLHPIRYELDNQPTKLSWQFQDPKGIYYPRSTKLLVIVQKESESHEAWFPFQLQLDWQLKVEVHTQNPLRRVLRLVNRPDKHDGWRFNIMWNYNPEKAQEALEDAEALDGRDHTIVGLQAATRTWIAAQQK
ncbi:hypothetical protein M422DRAFT_266751 [Sphaerobolus stellatus SS14]|uniref:Uncharacterized protein n=1 Tax=Sphaerobolus stellatus (strain SS14) TaxID=990650 RepID=A0A0C9V203_SPHS4|nr:hypothetical protein M422DRAFT_266751 [Sphaerobolus stellatus SS14]